jgi:hypothetical protein
MLLPLNHITMNKLWVVLISVWFLPRCQNQPAFEAPLFDNLGTYQISISSDSDYAQRFFTQGVIMANGFNHAEAARSFREVIKIDPECAMAYWGPGLRFGSKLQYQPHELGSPPGSLECN